MKNVLDKSCRENEITHILFSDVFPKITAFEIMSKYIGDRGPQVTSQRGAYSLHAGLARVRALMGMHTPTRSDTECTHACTQTKK